MKDKEFNIWRDMFGYRDEDGDGDVDSEDVAWADYTYRQVDKQLHPRRCEDVWSDPVDSDDDLLGDGLDELDDIFGDEDDDF